MFPVFINIFVKWPSRAWCVFDINIAGTQSKSKLRKMDCCCIKTINTIYFAAAWFSYSLFSKKNCKIWSILYLLEFIFDACSNNIKLGYHKTGYCSVVKCLSY